MLRAAAVGAAGAVGAVSRYWIGLAIGTRAFRWATLSINVVGSFALGERVGLTPGAQSSSPSTSPMIFVIS